MDYIEGKKFTDLKDALTDVDFVQECAPENYALKIELIKKISQFTESNAIISSSTLIFANFSAALTLSPSKSS